MEEGEALGEEVGGLRRQLRFRKQPAPRGVAGVARRRVGRDRGADHRAHAVGADHQVGGLGASVGEADLDRVAPIHGRGRRAAELVALVGEALAEGAVHAVPGELHLRGGDAVDDASGPVERDALARDHTDLRDVLAADRAQDGEDLALADETGAAPVEPLTRPLGDRDVEARLAQQNAGEQPAEGPADNDRLALNHPPTPPAPVGDHSRNDRGGSAHRRRCT